MAWCLINQAQGNFTFPFLPARFAAMARLTKKGYVNEILSSPE
jgi:hypothetical protein